MKLGISVVVFVILPSTCI